MLIQNKTTIGILVGLVVLIAIGAIERYLKTDLDLIAYIGGVSTLAVALLTAAYVITTTSQLSVMKRQLDEMRKAREYQAQPLPILRDVYVSIEKPRLFYTPPLNSYTAQSRILVKFRINNEGSHPAINTVSSAWIAIPSSTGSRLFTSASCLAETIAEGGWHPPTDGTQDIFLFTGDSEGEFIGTIREKNLSQPPILKVRSVFKNAHGASFATTAHFMLYLDKSTDEEIFTDWHTAIVSFPVKNKSNLDELSKVKKHNNDDEWDRLFTTMRDEFSLSIGGPEEIRLACVAIPLKFSVELLSEDEYETETSSVGFGHHIPAWFDGCINDHSD